MNKEVFLEILKKEGFYEAFEHAGLKCRIMRPHLRSRDQLKDKYTPMIYWCGYVGVDKSNFLYKKGYSEQIELTEEMKSQKYEWSMSFFLDALKGGYTASLATVANVHGGLTYANDGIYLQPEKDLWWFGFDCGHSGDISSVNEEYNDPIFHEDIYRDKKYVIEETKKLAEFLSKYSKEK